MKQNKFQWPNVLTLSFSHFAHDVYGSFLAPMLPLLKERLGLSYSLIGMLNLIQRLPFLLNPVFGILADKIHARYFVILTPAVTAICMSLLGLSSGAVMLGILLFVQGISSALFHVPSPVMMRKVSGERIGLGMSFYMLGGETARAVGPLAVVGAISVWGLEGTYRLMPFGIFASILLYIRLNKIKISQDIKKSSSSKEAWRGIKEYRFLLLGILGFHFFRGIMKSSLMIFLPTYFTDKGESLLFSGSSLSVLEFAGMFGTVLAGAMSDRLGRTNLLYVIAIVTPVLMFGFTISDGIMIFPILLALGFFLLASGPVVLAMVNETKCEYPSFLNSIYMFLNFVSASVTAVIVGVMSDVWGIEQTFLYSSFIALLAIPFVWLLKKKS